MSVKAIKDYAILREMTVEEYEEKFPENKVFFGDKFYGSVAECIKDIYESDEYTTKEFNRLNYIFGTSKDKAVIEAEDILNSVVESIDDIESYDLPDEAIEEINNFAEEWNKKYSRTVYQAQFRIRIVITDEYKEAVINGEIKATI